MVQRVSEHQEIEPSPPTGPVVIEYASPVAKPRRRPWVGLLALAVYGASLLLPAVDFQLFSNSSNSAMPGYAAAHVAFAMTLELFQGEWMGPVPVLGAMANVSVVTSIAFLLFARTWRAATWTASLAVLCMLGCLPLYADLRVGYIVWVVSAVVCLVEALTRRRRAIR
jgi:hypothetical protein